MDYSIPLVVLVLLVVSVGIRFVFAKRLVGRSARKPQAPAKSAVPKQSSAAAPKWFSIYLKEDFLDPAFQQCGIRVHTSENWQEYKTNILFMGNDGDARRYLVAAPAKHELVGMDQALKKIGWTRGAQKKEDDGYGLVYVRDSSAVAQRPQAADTRFNTARVTDAQAGRAFSAAFINAVIQSDEQWQVAVRFGQASKLVAEQDFTVVSFDQLLQFNQVLKIVADLESSGWQETWRIYRQANPRAGESADEIIYALER